MNLECVQPAAAFSPAACCGGADECEIGPPKQHKGLPASPATGAKTATIDEVAADLKAIAGTAATIAKKEPGFDASFRITGSTQRAVLADAASFLKELEKEGVAERFIAYAMDPDFVQDLRDDLASVDGDQDEQEEDAQDSTGETARVRALIKEGRELIKSLNTSVKNRFRNDPEVLAKWKTASHIQRTPRRGDDPAPPAPATTPAG